VLDFRSIGNLRCIFVGRFELFCVFSCSKRIEDPKIVSSGFRHRHKFDRTAFLDQVYRPKASAGSSLDGIGLAAMYVDLIETPKDPAYNNLSSAIILRAFTFFHPQKLLLHEQASFHTLTHMKS
jgi:hypothetical protein